MIHFGFWIFFWRKIKINEDNEKIGRVVCVTQRGPSALKKNSEVHSEIRFNSGAARSGKEKNPRRIKKNRFSSGAAHRGFRGKASRRLGTMGSTRRYGSSSNMIFNDFLQAILGLGHPTIV